MRKIVLFVIGLLVVGPVVVQADMVDILTIKLHDGCSMAQLGQLHADFNAYAEKNGGAQSDLLAPLHSASQGVFFVVARHPSVEAFGKANDAYRAQVGVEGSAAAALQKRAMECASIVARESAVTVK